MFQNFSGFLLSPPPRRPPLPPLLLPPPLLHAARNAAVAAPPATPRKPRRVKAAPLDCVGIECSSPMAAPLARHRPFVVERPRDVVVLVRDRPSRLGQSGRLNRCCQQRSPPRRGSLPDCSTPPIGGQPLPPHLGTQPPETRLAAYLRSRRWRPRPTGPSRSGRGDGCSSTSRSCSSRRSRTSPTRSTRAGCRRSSAGSTGRSPWRCS